MNVDQQLAAILDVEVPPANSTLPAIPTVEVPDVSPAANNTAGQDSRDARHTIRTLIAQGTLAVAELLQIARDVRTPRAYEVASGMLKTLAELNHDLLQVHQTEQILIETNAPGEVHNHIENAVFVGSTSDLGELIKQKRLERYCKANTANAEVIDVATQIQTPT
jgi:hypothetical protein